MDILWRVKYVLLFHTTNVFFRFQWLNVMRELDPTTEHHSVSGETTNMAVPVAGMRSFKNKRSFQKWIL